MERTSALNPVSTSWKTDRQSWNETGNPGPLLLRPCHFRITRAHRPRAARRDRGAALGPGARGGAAAHGGVTTAATPGTCLTASSRHSLGRRSPNTKQSKRKRACYHYLANYPERRSRGGGAGPQSPALPAAGPTAAPPDCFSTPAARMAAPHAPAEAAGGPAGPRSTARSGRHAPGGTGPLQPAARTHSPAPSRGRRGGTARSAHRPSARPRSPAAGPPAAAARAHSVCATAPPGWPAPGGARGRATTERGYYRSPAPGGGAGAGGQSASRGGAALAARPSAPRAWRACGAVPVLPRLALAWPGAGTSGTEHPDGSGPDTDGTGTRAFPRPQYRAGGAR